MSYILDALKKSDQQRQRGATPTLLTTQTTAVASKKPSFLLYGLLALVLVGAGVAIGSLRPWQAEETAPATKSVASAKPLESSPRRTVPAPLPAPPQIANTPETPLKAAAPGALSSPVPTSAVIKQDESVQTHRPPHKAVAIVPKPVASPMPDKPVDARLAEQRVMPMAELPLSIQQEIPKMSVSAHAYSTQPRDRLVSINDQLLREGMTVAPGLTLEQITTDGMIFSYKGYRFRRGVRSSGATAETQ